MLKMMDSGKYSGNNGLGDVSGNSLLITGSLNSENLLLQTDLEQDSVSSENKAISDSIPYINSPEIKSIDDGLQYLQPISYTEMLLPDTAMRKEAVLPIHKVNSFNTDWLTILMFVALALLASVRFTFANYISSLFQSVVNYSTSSRMFRERNYSILSGAFRLDVLYYIIFSVFILQILDFFSVGPQRPGILQYGKIIGLVILYFILKKFIYKLLGIIFKGIPETSEFIFNIDNFNRVTGIILIPIVALLAFYPYEYMFVIVIAGITAVFGLYLFLLGRGVSILLRKQFSILYLFLYLCTLEFLPLLLIFKVVAE